jgi:hypothetical protein
MRTTIIAVSLVVSACDLSEPPDPGPPCPGQGFDERAHATVSGSVVDFATGAPVAGAQVDVNNGWETFAPFPEGCPPIATFTTRDDGTFGPETLAIGSSVEPPILIFLVTGADRAQTASDLRVNGCVEAQCGDVVHSIAAPAADLAAAWRTELAAGGMPLADERGLIAFEFREPDGTPAAGVRPSTTTGTGLRLLEPGSEMRFLDADRATMAPADQSSTLASGLALTAFDAPDDRDTEIRYVGGERGEEPVEHWFSVGCLVRDGWVFLEDRRKTN